MVMVGGQLEHGALATRASPMNVPLSSPLGQHGTPFSPSGISIHTCPPSHRYTTSEVYVVVIPPSWFSLRVIDALAWSWMGPVSRAVLQLVLILRLW